MGNSAASTTPLPKIWTRINNKFLKNIHTQDIIQQHQSIHPTQQQQLQFINLLKQRISLHHPNIIKIIYYKNSVDQSFCNSIFNKYITYSYTEYSGETLQQFLTDPTKQIEFSPFSQIIIASQYLQIRYGFFKITQKMIFLGRQLQNNIKIWINSQLENCSPQYPSNQEQMCRSLNEIFQLLKNSKLVKDIYKYQLEYLKKITTLKQMKAYILKISGQFKNFYQRQKKASSLYINKRAQQQQINNRFKTNAPKLVQVNTERKQVITQKRGILVPHFNNQNNEKKPNKLNFLYHSLKTPNSSANYTIKGPSVKNQINPNQYTTQRSFTKSKNYQSIDNQIVNPHFFGKIRFVFSDKQKQSQLVQNQVSPLQQYKPNIPIIQQRNMIDNINPKNLQQEKIKEIKKTINFLPQDHKTLFSPNIGTYACSIQNSLQNSLSNSPEIPKAVLDNPLIIRQKPQYEIKQDHQNFEKKPTVLPTTSRSPQHIKNYKQQTKQQFFQGKGQNTQKKIIQDLLATEKHRFTYKTNAKSKSSSNKFEKFQNAIKKYQQKLKQQIKMTGGNKNKKKNNYNPHNAIKGIVSSQNSSKQQYKQTKSLYHDSSNQKVQEKPYMKIIQNTYFVQIQTQKCVEQSANKTKKLKIDIQKISLAKSKQFFEQINDHSNSSSSEFKNDFQLQINNQRNGSLTEEERKCLIKQQYQSIREKVKHKKQTFAQLKAEATKILEDFNF